MSSTDPRAADAASISRLEARVRQVELTVARSFAVVAAVGIVVGLLATFGRGLVDVDNADDGPEVSWSLATAGFRMFGDSASGIRAGYGSLLGVCFLVLLAIALAQLATLVLIWGGDAPGAVRATTTALAFLGLAAAAGAWLVVAGADDDFHRGSGLIWFSAGAVSYAALASTAPWWSRD